MQDAGYGPHRIFLPRTSVNRGLLGWLLAFRGRLGAQPQRDVSGLHRFLGHPHQVVAQSAYVRLLSHFSERRKAGVRLRKTSPIRILSHGAPPQPRPTRDSLGLRPPRTLSWWVSRVRIPPLTLFSTLRPEGLAVSLSSCGSPPPHTMYRRVWRPGSRPCRPTPRRRAD